MPFTGLAGEEKAFAWDIGSSGWDSVAGDRWGCRVLRWGGVGRKRHVLILREQRKGAGATVPDLVAARRSAPFGGLLFPPAMVGSWQGSPEWGLGKHSKRFSFWRR